MDDRFFLFITYLALLILIVPIAVLYWTVGAAGLMQAFENYQFIESVLVTLVGALAATLLNVAIGTPVAYSLSRRLVRAESAFYDIFLSPVSIPHTVVGIMLLLAFSPVSPLYPALRYISPVDNLLGLSLAMFYVSFPIYLMSIKETFDKSDLDLELFIQSLGRSRFYVFTRVVFPENAGSVLRIALLSMGRAISEFGSLIIIAYSVTFLPFFRYVMPATVFIWYNYDVYGLSASLGYAAGLLTISLLISLGVYLLSRRNA